MARYWVATLWLRNEPYKAKKTNLIGVGSIKRFRPHLVRTQGAQVEGVVVLPAGENRLTVSEERLRELLIGGSEVMQRLRKHILQVADTEASVLIWGESGTGKELVARGIHELSSRNGKTLVPLNCGAIPKELFESELFGHEKGAFSGALSARVGRFELAHRGTLFLDEVGEMPLELQVKMLRALQEKTIERVGSVTPIRVDVRIVSATNHCLTTAVADGRFREDIFYRLNVYPILVPPLRERGEDVIELFNHLALELALPGNRPISLSGYARVELLNRHWPGNVRELRNLVERLSILYPGQEITLETLPPLGQLDVRSTDGQRPPQPAPEAPADSPQGNLCLDEPSRADLPNSASTAEERALLWGSESTGFRGADSPSAQTPVTAVGRVFPDPDLNEGIHLKDHLAQIEVDLIERALKCDGGNVTLAARRLNLRRTTLIEKIRKYRIQVPGAKETVSS